MEYENYEFGLKIYFNCPEMDLREVGLVSSTLHRVVNKVAEQILEQPSRRNHLDHFESKKGVRVYDPLVVSLAVTNLEYGSFWAETKLRILAVFLAAGGVASGVASNIATDLLTSVIKSMYESAPKSTLVAASSPMPQSTSVDVGPNLRYMASGLAASGKPWELVVEDSRSGTRVTIKSH